MSAARNAAAIGCDVSMSPSPDATSAVRTSRFPGGPSFRLPPWWRARVRAVLARSRVPIAALLVLLAAPACAPDTGPVGAVTKVVGMAEVVSAGQDRRRLEPGTLVVEGDRVRTGGGRIEITLEDGSVLRMGEQSDLLLAHVVDDAERRNIVLAFAGGILRAVVGPVTRPSRVQVNLPTAVIGVRGTDWIMEADGASSAIVTLEGSVEVAPTDPARGPSVMLGADEGTSVDAGAAPKPVSVWAEARKQSFIARTEVE